MAASCTVEPWLTGLSKIFRSCLFMQVECVYTHEQTTPCMFSSLKKCWKTYTFLKRYFRNVLKIYLNLFYVCVYNLCVCVRACFLPNFHSVSSCLIIQFLLLRFQCSTGYACSFLCRIVYGGKPNKWNLTKRYSYIILYILLEADPTSWLYILGIKVIGGACAGVTHGIFVKRLIAEGKAHKDGENSKFYSSDSYGYGVHTVSYMMRLAYWFNNLCSITICFQLPFASCHLLVKNETKDIHCTLYTSRNQTTNDSEVSFWAMPLLGRYSDACFDGIYINRIHSLRV